MREHFVMRKDITSKFSVLLIALAALLWASCHNPDQPLPDAPVRIGISWRSDLDSEFYTNVVTTLKACGATPVLLQQVVCHDLSYTGNQVSQENVDEVGCLTLSAAGKLRAAESNNNAADIAKDIDAIIFTGGEDISPSLFATPQPWHGIEAERDYNATRDVNDFALMGYCLKQDISVLGFCRGMQMLGVASGATVIQDIPTFFAQRGEEYNYIHRNEKTSPDAYRDYSPHNVSVVPGSILHDMAGDEMRNVPSWHHQSLLSVEGTPLRMTGYTIVNNLEMIEAIERTDKTLVMGLQFHPEAAIVKHLTGAANKDQFTSLEDAKKIFTFFIQRVKARKSMNVKR